MGRLIFQRGTSSKFWEGKVEGATLTVRFGRLGSAGQTKAKKLATPAAAKAALEELNAEKLRKGYVAERPASNRAKTSSKKAVPRKPTVPPARRAALIALATKLGDRALAGEVSLAVDDPAGYLAKFRERMDDIGVDEPRPDLGWLAITEGLSARETAVELDWKQEPSDALAWVRGLAGSAGKKALAGMKRDPDLDERRTDEALELFGKALVGAKLALVQLDKGSDSYVVMVRRSAEVPALRTLARKAGGEVRWFDGKGLAALEAERRREEAKEEAAARSSNRWTRLVQSTWEKNSDGALWKLRHHPYPVEDIRAAMSGAPQKDRPLIAMVLELHDRPATEVARATGDPKLCLRALRYLGQEHRFGKERLGAAAILAARLGVQPGHGRLQTQLADACNLFSLDGDADRALASLPSAVRKRLARLADGLLVGADFQSDRWNDAYRALQTVGDESSLPVIEASRSKVPAKWAGTPIPAIEKTIGRIRARAG